jgi:alkylhydroperoxidase/carboxymuconolactone decarboxylase family protein YurZ
MDPEHGAGDGSPAAVPVKLQLFGPPGEAPQRTDMDALAPDVSELVDHALWASMWERPGVELRTKSLCTISTLLALERYPYARHHIGAAKRLGLSRDEVTGVVVHLLFYTGLPVVHEGLKLVAEVFGDED